MRAIALKCTRWLWVRPSPEGCDGAPYNPGPRVLALCVKTQPLTTQVSAVRVSGSSNPTRRALPSTPLRWGAPDVVFYVGLKR